MVVERLGRGISFGGVDRFQLAGRRLGRRITFGVGRRISFYGCRGISFGGREDISFGMWYFIWWVLRDFIL